MNDGLLSTLKDVDQWVCWTYETRDGEETKPPIVPRDGQKYASTSDSATWGSYEEAVEYHNRDDTDTEGVGFVLTEDDVYAGADLDGCRDPESGEIEPWAEDVVDQLDSYAEVSPSGTGLRVFLLGFMPDGRTRREQPNGLEATAELDKTTELEMYDDGRYLTFTGDHLQGTPRDAQQRNSAFRSVHEEYLAEDDENDANDSSRDDESHDAPDLDLDDETVLQRAREADNGDKFRRLENGYDGFHSGDTSKADKAFCQMLAFWTGGDRAQMDRLFRNSDRMRDKWDEVHSADGDTYGEMTIAAALNDQTEFYDPSGGSHQPDPAEIDWSEVERGERILRAETSPTDPYGELEHKNGCYGYSWTKTDDDGNVLDSGFDTVANFTLELDTRLDTYEGEILKIIVRPDSPMEDEYEVQVHPTVFNEPRSFREEIVRGRTTYFDTGRRSTHKVLTDLRQTVGRQNVPQREGTEFIGLHGDGLDEWVTPGGTLTAGGWTDDVEYAYYEKSSDNTADLESSSLGNKVEIEPEMGDEIDEDELGDLLEVLPWTRKPSRGLPVLGWFYAAPLKPIIQEEEGQFNLLQVAGGTGTGKTSTLEMYYQLFGAAPSPFSCDDTRFTIEKRLSNSCGLPIWLDEFKPTDMDERHLKWLYQKFREVFRGASTSKGRPSLGEVLFHFRAPVVFSGEQTVSKPAVRRRTVITQFSSKSTTDEYERAYSEVVGASYETESGSIESFDGFDLQNHALAYYQYVLEQSPDTIRNLWRAAQKKQTEFVQSMGLGSLDRSEKQGLQTVIFGFKMFSKFAEAMGADPDELPGEQELRDAVEHVAMNIGPDGRRRQHIDDFTELLAQASAAEYLQQGEHYKLISTRKFDTENALAFHMPSCFSAVKKYIRDYGLESEYSMLARADYVDNYADRADEGQSYPLATNHRVKGLGRGGRAVLIDADRAEEYLGSGFSLQSFVDLDREAEETGSDSDGGGSGGAQPSHPSPVAIGEIDPSQQDVASTIGKVEFGQYDGRDTSDGTPAWTATLSDQTGEAELVVWSEENIPQMYDSTGVFEPDALYVQGVEVGQYDGQLQLEIGDGTAIEKAQVGAGHTSSEDVEDGQNELSDEASGDTKDAAADGGKAATTADSDAGPPDDAQGTRADAARLAKVLEDEGHTSPDDAITPSTAAGLKSHDLSPPSVKEALEYGATKTNPALFQRDRDAGVYWLN